MIRSYSSSPSWCQYGVRERVLFFLPLVHNFFKRYAQKPIKTKGKDNIGRQKKKSEGSAASEYIMYPQYVSDFDSRKYTNCTMFYGLGLLCVI
jgi:hypothetical protein